jgi:hypothetical protein
VISFIRQLFICVWCQWWPLCHFRVLSTAPNTAPSFDETAWICAIPAVVDTRRALRARETTARGGGVTCRQPYMKVSPYMQAFQLHDFHTVIRCKEYRMSPNSLKRFLYLKMLNSAPKWHKCMPEIPNMWFYCGNSNIRDLLQILATEIQTNFNNSPRQNVPKLCWKAKKTCPQNRLKKYKVKGLHAIERPDIP